MQHLKAIGIKFIVISIALYSVLAGFYTATIGNIFVMSILITGVAYLIGDLFILPKLGNIIATLADFGLAFLAIWMLADTFFAEEYGIVTAALFTAILISSTEAVFHIYMQNKVLKKNEEIYINRSNSYSNNMLTEFAEEDYDPDVIELNKYRKKQ